MNIPIKTQTSASSRVLAGKVALVTGSTSGIGLGIARALAASGADIVLNGLGVASEIGRTREQIAAEFGVKASYSPADMTRPKSIAEMIAATVAQSGRLDILVNNAGIQHVAPLDRFPVEKWDQILAINLSSAFHTTRLALPAMRQNGFGRIINIASAHGLVGSPFKAAYVAAKHGIVGLTKVTALETAEEGITCNAVCPGYVYTPLVEAQIDGQAKAHGISRDQVIRDVLLAQQPNKRFATVEELGALVVFLSTDAAASITGVALPVDGGWTAH
ncbi:MULTISPECIES: 3-hydroxybutyrate dehydrogenase [Bradyrhizobium]|uniref:3-hydroxybutyrate dehydrogenase n=1 Tax=Bradyrhizobium TaxID=374 RepID=UPI00155E29EE|nr:MULTISPECIES: 3-hydroxybutyrate dehydrogenase [Bradyrhizobium]MDD1518176.1 3-hydroxybutyrate dehydrogenase [Bradyrhizobium sp. WBAH30]MDD1540478.1 3-hydroxybutyrate dehydrogenase [Bradyrhizobium sp. WBAH41]MDD1556077.1 3-hydroxybutyrate dehydrogenase [Bradyrhizobium sp. WBAH23]MDD1563113.1 3-hydroxybutyrate dehydrogenase [Bradyrhizobium sp. WBAH33]MDD1588385.1 3-hydroxybutyrate dehydrogenase [Bradyrhizobium sp. WBAH42]